MPQRFGLYEDLSVQENLDLYADLQGLSASERNSAFDRLLDFTDLGAFRARLAGKLSGGMKQRAALARALSLESRIVLMDEPFGALDAQVRKSLRRWLRQFHDEIGLTTLFVTHDQEEALELADQVVVMRNARVEQVGKPQTVYDQPRSPFVYGEIEGNQFIYALCTPTALNSSFNPFAQSAVGAQGLMQVMTSVHDEKYSSFGGKLAAFDPVTNLRVGVKVLQECIQRAGSLQAGLRFYVGAGNQPDDGGYADKVMAEHARLLQVASGRAVPLMLFSCSAKGLMGPRSSPSMPAFCLFFSRWAR